MNDRQTNALLDAVDALTLPRQVHTTITDDDTGDWLSIHTEEHPPLLTMLLEGTGISRGSASSDPGIPIDADALEIYAQIRDIIRLWCKQLKAPYGELLPSIRVWYLAHTNAVRGGRIGQATDLDVTRMVQGWVRMIENKFEPDEKREWTDPCPALLPVLDELGRVEYQRCNALRVTTGNAVRFAIHLNVTKMVAECCACQTRWEGRDEIMDLRIQTNISEAAKKDAIGT